MDANPWRSFSRIVASCHYLRQPDVLEQFRSACRTPVPGVDDHSRAAVPRADAQSEEGIALRLQEAELHPVFLE